MAKAKRTVRELTQAAKMGNRSAMTALLRLHGYDQAAREIKTGRPLSNRTTKILHMLTTGVSLPGEPLLDSERVSERGEIYNIFDSPIPLSQLRGRARRVDYFDD